MEQAHLAAAEPKGRSDPRLLQVLLVSSSSGSQGGGELYLVGLAQGLRALGHSVTALLAKHPRMDELAGLLGQHIPVERMAYRNTYDRRFRSLGAVLDRRGIRRLAERFPRHRPDLVHLNQQNLEDGLDLVLAAARSGLPWMATVHITRGMAALGAKAGWLRDDLARRVMRRTQGHWLTIADRCGDELERFLGSTLPAGHVHRVPNGIAKVPAGERRRVRREWGCGEDELVLGCVARLEAQKNPLLLLRLLSHLPPHVRLVWIGDGRLRPVMLAEAQRLGVAARVHLDGWRHDARQRMSGFDLYLLPSQYEGLPLAVLEAMAAGLPCVASRVDGLSEAIVDGVSGVLCPPDDEEVWEGVLQRLIKNRDECERLGRQARRRYEERFSLEQMARATVEAYFQVRSV